MRASFGTSLAAAALASFALFGCNESQRNPEDNASMAAGAPAVRAVATNAAEPTGGLVGRRYVVQVMKRGEAEAQLDTLSFEGGRFQSQACDRMGFAAADARVVADNVGEAFTAVSASDREGQIEWSGMLVKGRLDGRYVWKKPGAAPVEYEFKGYPADR